MVDMDWLHRAIESGKEKRDARRAQAQTQQTEKAAAAAARDRNLNACRDRLAPHVREVNKLLAAIQIQEELKHAGIEFRVSPQTGFQKHDVRDDLDVLCKEGEIRGGNQEEDSWSACVAYGYSWEVYIPRGGTSHLELFLGENGLPLFTFSHYDVKAPLGEGLSLEELKEKLGTYIGEAVANDPVPEEKSIPSGR